MNNEIARYSEETFESIKHVNEYGNEFWYARELQSILEYTEWRNFQKLIEKLARHLQVQCIVLKF